jgi:hypothetical protein
MKEVYSTKNINPNYYFVLGTDDGHAVLYVYKDGELFDWHVSSGSTFAQEMMNTMQCYSIVHNEDPKLIDIFEWRKWFMALKEKGEIR